MQLSKKYYVLFLMVISALIYGILFPSFALAEEKSIVYARPRAGEMDPATLASSEGLQNVYMVYDSLVMVDDSGKVVPCLVESWEASSDYKDYTLNLRKGVKFHDGTPFNAQAVKFSLNRMLRVNKMTFGANWPVYGNEESCEIVDDYTLKIHLVKPFPLFMKDMMYYLIISPDYVKKHSSSDDPDAAKWLTDHACGTGPFKLVEYVASQKLVFQKFKDYWGGANIKETPKVDKIIHRIVTDSATARMMVERGDADIAEKLTAEEFEKMESTQGIRVINLLIPRTCYITMDVSKPPFNDLNVRRAISYAINYGEIIKYIERDKVAPLRGLTPKGIPGYDSRPPAYKYDPVKAKELIKSSGYPNGFTTNLIFALERRTEFQQVTEYIQAYLKKIGVDVKIQKVAFDTQIAKMEKGDYGMSLMWWTAIMPDPDDIAGWLYDSSRASGGWNGSYWHDKDVQAKLKKCREIADHDERMKLYREVEDKAVDLAIYVVLYQLNNQFAVRNNIKNFNYDAKYKIHFWSMDKE